MLTVLTVSIAENTVSTSQHGETDNSPDDCYMTFTSDFSSPTWFTNSFDDSSRTSKSWLKSKKERNREAAARLRKKRQMENKALLEEENKQLLLNKHLKEQEAKLSKEISILKQKLAKKTNGKPLISTTKRQRKN